ncbi:MAG: ParB/RepB/Spo0J family partition protein [Halothece sp.]
MNAQSRRKYDKSFPKAKSNTKQDAVDFLSGAELEAPSSRTLRIDQIVFRDSQPRRYFNQEKLAQLAESIKEHGILENLLVRPSPREEAKYELVSGERRLRAAQKAGLNEVPVQIQNLEDQQVLEIALIENLQREDLNPIEELEGIVKLLSYRLNRPESEVPKRLNALLQSQKRKPSQSHNVMGQAFHDVEEQELAILQQVFQQLGRMSWESFTANRLPLLKLPEDILEALREGKIEYTKAKVIAKIDNEEQRKNLLNLAIQEHLSIRNIRDKVKAIQQSQSDSSEQITTVEPPKRLDHLTKRIKNEKTWEKSPERWQQIESYLEQIERLLELEDEAETNQSSPNKEKS